MTRDGLDVDVLHSKLDAIDRATTTLRSITPLDASRLRSEPVTAAAVERLTCRLVDLAADINTHISSVLLGRAPENYRDSFDLMERTRVLTAELVGRIKPSVGMRNAIVHEYIRINYDIVAAAVPLALDTYSEYRRQVAGFVYDRATG
ncbi:type VII toxin-antitoxin system HepT family RNase toxin [Actinopolyspora mortivallis]|uniref:type VII toxin-antitoxin system HepT family RNase toxin n=1 Tax=Actinopolyspora mortivallis TaxID=33906 RepID=UPI00037884B2|nr:DUF86 domain-containing protein [Actinopolyspora mortivallis]